MAPHPHRQPASRQVLCLTFLCLDAVCTQALAALRKLAAQLKEMDTPGGSGSHAAAAADKGSMSSSDADSDAEHVDCTADDSVKGLKKEQQQHAGVEQLEHRRSAQLQPTVLRLVKELLTQGGGKTD